MQQNSKTLNPKNRYKVADILEILADYFKKVSWCPRPESNWYAPFLEAADFKSDVSTYFTTRAGPKNLTPEQMAKAREGAVG